MTAPAPQVLIVGAGPAGLAAARALIECGIDDILIIDRDDAPGGLPRFCHHPGFGLEYARWPQTGPGFVARLLRDIADSAARIECRTTLLSLRDGPVAEIVGPRLGPAQIRPKAVILATGIREANRGNRLVPGGRAESGIMTTGHLQQVVARKTALPPQIKTLAVIGTEHVAFSAIWTARQAGLSVVALVGEEDRVMSFGPLARLARMLGVRVLTGARIREIETEHGATRAIRLDAPGGPLRVPCDSVVFTADWIPEVAGLTQGPVACDPRTGGPAIDQTMRTSCPGVFAAGNVLHGVESSGWCAKEGRHAGMMVARYLRGDLSGDQGQSRFELADEIAYMVPQLWDDRASHAGPTALPTTLRMARDMASARLVLDVGDQTIWSGHKRGLLRRRRVKLDLGVIPPRDAARKRVRVVS